VTIEYKRRDGTLGRGQVSLPRLQSALSWLSKNNALFKDVDMTKFLQEVRHCEELDLEEEISEGLQEFEPPTGVPVDIWQYADRHVTVVLRLLRWNDGVMDNETAAVDADPVAPSGSPFRVDET